MVDNNTVDKEMENSKQKIAVKLREKFLMIMSSLAGQPCTINMYERTSVTAEFQGSNSDISEIYVRNLLSPSGTFHEHALLRMGDIIDIEI